MTCNDNQYHFVLVKEGAIVMIGKLLNFTNGQPKGRDEFIKMPVLIELGKEHTHPKTTTTKSSLFQLSRR